MKKILLTLIIILIPMMAMSDNMYQRYLKLGNTYMNAGNMEKADEYLQKGKTLAMQAKDQYWVAVSYEYYGYLYANSGKQAEAEKSMQHARELYNKIIKQKDGSPYAIEEIEIRLGLMDYYQMNGTTNSQSNGSIYYFDNKKLDDIQIPANPTNLSMSKCRIKDMGFLTSKTTLQYLNLSNNRIKTIPTAINNMINLVSLDLSNNRIKQLPVEYLAELPNLRVLNLKGNKISFEDIINIVRLMPNTNIYFDEYVLKEEIETGNENTGIYGNQP